MYLIGDKHLKIYIISKLIKHQISKTSKLAKHQKQ